MISIIAAATANNVIGSGNTIPWYISDDLKRFKALTSGHHVIMGRKTFESLKSTPLSNRINIVVTHNKDNVVACNPVIQVSSLECALLKAMADNEVFIIGGGQIYKKALEFANRIYLTRIYNEIPGDIFFPDINLNEWEVIEYMGNFQDEKSGLLYSYITYQRKI